MGRLIASLAWACMLGVLDSEPAKSGPDRSLLVQAAAEPSLEYKLATIDFGFVRDSDPRIARFRSLLTQLDSKYVEDRNTIANQTVRAQEMLLKDGVQESMLKMMEGLNGVLPEALPNQRYGEYAAIYITLRAQGKTHDQTVDGVRGILKALMGR